MEPNRTHWLKKMLMPLKMLSYWILTVLTKLLLVNLHQMSTNHSRLMKTLNNWLLMLTKPNTLGQNRCNCQQ